MHSYNIFFILDNRQPASLPSYDNYGVNNNYEANNNELYQNNANQQINSSFNQQKNNENNSRNDRFNNNFKSQSPQKDSDPNALNKVIKKEYGDFLKNQVIFFHFYESLFIFYFIDERKRK